MRDPLLVQFSVKSRGFKDLGAALDPLRAGISRARRTWAFKTVRAGAGAIEFKLLQNRFWDAHAHLVVDVDDDDLDMWEHEVQKAFTKATDGRGRFSIHWQAPDIAPGHTMRIARYMHKGATEDAPWSGSPAALAVVVQSLHGRRLPVAWG
ncbi:MAG: hypothetical protein IPI67_01965 [Myxococcales bacterium]|nr:hypothetical protein [Myxococcales bacterium]